MVLAAFSEHANFKGTTFFRGTYGARYRWDNWWGPANDMFSSLRLWGTGERGNCYAFDDFGMRGGFAALNVGGAFSSSWWWYVGPDFNDVISSSLLVSRYPAEREQVIPLSARLVSQFVPTMDAKLRGKGLARNGNPGVHATFFPSWNSQGVFVTIEQAFQTDVSVGNLPDLHYDVNAKWHLQVSLDEGRLQAAVVYSEVSVTGVFSSYVSDAIAPQLHAASSAITAGVQSQLGLLDRKRFADVYLLPGREPDMNLAGFKGRDTDDVCLVLVD